MKGIVTISKCLNNSLPFIQAGDLPVLSNSLVHTQAESNESPRQPRWGFSLLFSAGLAAAL